MVLFLSNSPVEIFRKFCENLQAIDPLNYLPAAIVTPETSDIDSIKMNLMEAGAGVLNCNFFSLKTLIEKIQPMPVGKYRSATPKDLAVICRHVIETLPSGSEKILLKSNIYEFLKAVDDITHMDCNFSILGNQRFVAVAQALETWMKKYNIFSAEDCLNNQVANITDGNPKMFQLMVFYGFSWTHIHKLKIIDRLQSLAMDSSFYCLYDESNDMEFFWLEPLEKIFGEAKYLHSQNENNMPSVKITHTETQLTEALLVLDEIEKIISSHPTAHLGIVAPSHKCLTINIIDSILSSRGVTYYSTSPSFIPPSQKLSILYAWATFQQYLMPTSLLAFMRQLLANHILELDEFNKIIGEFSRAFDHILSKNFSLLLAFISMDKTTRSVPFFEKYPLLPPQATFGDFLKLMEENFPKTIAPEDVKTVMTFKVPISRANFCTRLKEAIRDKRRKISTHRQNNSKIWLLTSQQAEKYTFSHLFIVAANEQTWLSQSENIFLGDELECQTAINRKKHFLDNLGNLSPNIFITDHDKNVLTNSISTHIFEADRDKTGPKSSYFERLYRRHPKPSKNQIDEFKYVHNLRWDETAKFGEYDYSLGQNQIGNFTISCKAIERAMTNPVSVWNETILGIKNIQRFEADTVTIRRVLGTLVHNLLDFSFAKTKPQKIPTREVFHKILEAKHFEIYNRIKIATGSLSLLCENVLKDSLAMALKLADNIAEIGPGKWFLSEYPISGQVVVADSLRINTKGRVDMIITGSQDFPNPESPCENIVIDYKTGSDNQLTPSKFGKIDDHSGEINLGGLQLILYALALRCRGCKNLSLAVVKEDFLEKYTNDNIYPLNDFSNLTDEPVLQAIKNIAIHGRFGQQKYDKFFGSNPKQIATLIIPTSITTKRAAL